MEHLWFPLIFPLRQSTEVPIFHCENSHGFRWKIFPSKKSCESEPAPGVAGTISRTFPGGLGNFNGGTLESNEAIHDAVICLWLYHVISVLLDI